MEESDISDQSDLSDKADEHGRTQTNTEKMDRVDRVDGMDSEAQSHEQVTGEQVSKKKKKNFLPDFFFFD